jgi:dTMP kinase
VQSSLVLQGIDGLRLDEIWLYNRLVLPPALSIYLAKTPRSTGNAWRGELACPGWK